jgi:hypothetical protein
VSEVVLQKIEQAFSMFADYCIQPSDSGRATVNGWTTVSELALTRSPVMGQERVAICRIHNPQSSTRSVLRLSILLSASGNKNKQNDAWPSQRHGRH